MNKNFIFVALILGALAGNASALDQYKYAQPKDNEGAKPVSLSYHGAERLVISNSAAAVVVSSQAGVLLDVELSTGAATLFVVCADEETGGVLADFLINGSNASKKVLPPLFANTTNGDSASRKLGFTPVEFTEGLQCVVSAAGGEAVIKYLLNGRD
jgi:hypothetical protein